MKSAERPAPRRLYVDTSAYLCMLLGEEESDRLCKETERAVLLSSVLLVLEAGRTLIRLTREGLLRPQEYAECIDRLEQDLELFHLRDLTLDLCRSRSMPAVATPRSLDLAHLRTALRFNADEKIDRFVTIDSTQERAAEEMGLPT